jgi:hypothetical protein
VNEANDKEFKERRQQKARRSGLFVEAMDQSRLLPMMPKICNRLINRL